MFDDLFTAGVKPGRPWWPQLPAEVQAWCEGLADAIVAHGMEPTWSEAIAKFKAECGEEWLAKSKDTFTHAIRRLVKERG